MDEFKIRIDEFLSDLDGKTSPTYYINILRFFNKQLYPYYEKTGKRVEDFTIDDMADFMSHSKIALKIRSFENYCVLIRKYMRWCLDRGYVTQEELDKYFAFIPGVISNIFSNNKYTEQMAARKYFLSTQEYVQFVNTVFGAELSYQVDLIRDVSRFDSAKAILYLLWLGFSANEIITLTNEDFDMHAKTMRNVKIIDKDIYSYFCYYKPRAGFLRLRQRGNEYPTDYNDVSHFIKGTFNACNLITVRNAIGLAQERQKLLDDDNKFKHIIINASTIFYSQLFEKCYRAENELLNATVTPSSKTVESYIRDIIKQHIDKKSESAISKAYAEYSVYKALIEDDKQ